MCLCLCVYLHKYLRALAPFRSLLLLLLPFPPVRSFSSFVFTFLSCVLVHAAVQFIATHPPPPLFVIAANFPPPSPFALLRELHEPE